MIRAISAATSFTTTTVFRSEVVQTINGEGGVTQNYYDANGQMVQMRRYYNPLDAGSLRLLGDVTNLVYPGTANPFVPPATLPDDPRDQRSYFVYDNDGRQRFTLRIFDRVDWIISENRFDADGNVIETRTYDKWFDDTSDPRDVGKSNPRPN